MLRYKSQARTRPHPFEDGWAFVLLLLVGSYRDQDVTRPLLKLFFSGRLSIQRSDVQLSLMP
jgi:hypothetical protein